MAEILVVEQDAGHAERIAAALRSEAHDVTTATDQAAARERAASRLVVASATLPRVRELLGASSRQQGGPGAIVLVPVSLAGQVAAEDYDADLLLSKPFSDDDLRRSVRECLEIPAAAGRKPAGQALTSEDIFGDVLAEVEGGAPPAGRDDDIERKLEQTLSGVLPTRAKKRKPTRPAREATDGGINDLLDKTLSSLELPLKARPKTPRAPEPAPPSPARPQPPPAKAPAAPAAPGVAAKPAEPPRPAAPAPQAQPPGPGPAPAPPAARTPTPEPTPTPAPAPKPVVPEPLPNRPASVQEQLGGSHDAYRTQKLPVVSSISEASEGQTFGEFTLLRKIAVGGMAEVWLARRRGVEGFQKTVAIKKILSHLTGSPDFVTMFIDEAKLAAQLNHNNIIQIYDLGKVGDDFFIAMEYVDGKDLRSIVAAGRKAERPLPLGLSVMIAACLARALDYAHRKRDFDNRDLGLVHRDVSPQNVLISHEGEIKLCDFGIVKAVAKASTTQMGALKGKLQYMSPEQAWGKPVDARSDIFSLGSVMFEMLTGNKLFSADSEIGVLDAVRECRIRSPRELQPDVPEVVEKIVLKALTREPEDRYQTAGELDHELQAVLHDLSPTPSQTMLAAYMDVLFRGADPESRNYESRLIRKAEEPEQPREETPAVASRPVATSPAAAPRPRPEPSVFPSEEPAEETERPTEAAGGRKVGLVVAALVVVALLVAAFFFFGPDGGAPAPQQAAPPAAPAPPPTAPAPEEAADAGLTAAAGETAAGEAATGETAGAESAAGESALEGAPVDLEALVDQELEKRRLELQEKLEAEKRKLERELQKAQEAAAAGGGSTGSGG